LHGKANKPASASGFGTPHAAKSRKGEDRSTGGHEQLSQHTHCSQVADQTKQSGTGQQRASANCKRNVSLDFHRDDAALADGGHGRRGLLACKTGQRRTDSESNFRERAEGDQQMACMQNHDAIAIAAHSKKPLTNQGSVCNAPSTKILPSLGRSATQNEPMSANVQEREDH
jgi:hypothetical protein